MAGKVVICDQIIKLIETKTVFLGGWMDGWVDRWIDGRWMDGWMDGWIDGWMEGSKSRLKDCLQQ